MTEIDLPLAAEILAQFGDPPLLRRDGADDGELTENERSDTRSDEQLDRALNDALLRLRYTVNRQTFEFLRWKVLVARESASSVLSATRDARAQRASAVGEVRWFRTELLDPWSVTEMAISRSPSAPRSCLVFASPEAVRRVWTYPANWRELSDAELERLSWMR